MATIPITKRGAEKLKAELHKLKTVERPWVINAIAEARAQGDLSENAEYDAPRTARASSKAASRKSKASCRPPRSSTRRAGCRRQGGVWRHGRAGRRRQGDKVTYQIVGEDEADLKQGLINIGSPIARALIGKEEGDTAEVQAPGGVRRYEIIGVDALGPHRALRGCLLALLVEFAWRRASSRARI
jgi:transcription elongation factor GreA